MADDYPYMSKKSKKRDAKTDSAGPTPSAEPSEKKAEPPKPEGLAERRTPTVAIPERGPEEPSRKTPEANLPSMARNGWTLPDDSKHDPEIEDEGGVELRSRAEVDCGDKLKSAIDEGVGVEREIARQRAEGNWPTAAESERPVDGQAVSVGTRRAPKKKWLGDALLLLEENPNLSDARIAREVGVHASTLSRCDKYQRAAAYARGQRTDIRRGFKDPETGQIETPE